MAIFQAFFDESGKFKDKRVVSFCGFVAPLPKVREFEEEWSSILKQYELSCLTMKRALRRTIPFSPNTRAESREERNAAFLPFIQCIRKHFELGVALTIDVAAFEKVPIQAKRRLGGSDDPHYLAFLQALTTIGMYVVGKDDKISLICDDDQATAVNCYKLYSRVRTLDKELKPKLVSISFADDDVFVPLQAADMMASFCRQEAGRMFHREYYEFVPSFMALTSQGSDMTWAVSFYSKEKLNALSAKLMKAKLG